MEEFKVLLDKYTKNVSMDSLAEACGISTRALYRYIKGERQPDSIERVRKMADFFRLTPEERKRFIASFKAVYYGDEQYRNLTLVDRLLRNLNSLKEMPEADLSFSGKMLSDLNDVKPFNDPESLKQAIRTIVFKEALQEKGKIRLHLDVDSSFVSEILMPACTKEIAIEHINPLRTNNDSRNILNFLNDILPVIVNSENYSIYTYYEKEISLSDISMSSLVITGEYAILANRALTAGLLFSSKEMIEYCKDMFRSYKAASSEFITSLSKENLTQDFFAAAAITFESPIRDMHTGLCITPHLTETIIRKYIQLDHPEAVIAALLRHAKYAKDCITKPSSLTTEIISLESMELFMETGLIREYPIRLYKPLEPEDRLYFLKENLKMAKEYHNYTVRFLKDDWHNRGTHVTCSFMKDAIFFTVGTPSGKVIVFSLNDPVIVSSFNRYFDTQIDDITYPADRSLKMLEDLLKEYE